MLTTHAGGGRAMLNAAADAARQTHQRRLVVGVTVLTSLDQAEFARIGVDRALLDQVEALADLARSRRAKAIVRQLEEQRARSLNPAA